MKFRSSLIDQGSGVLANMVLEKNGVIRTRNIPSNPNTTAQNAARAALTEAAIMWRDTLTQTQRDGWNAYATTVQRNDALGKPIKLTGIGLFVAAQTTDIALNFRPYGDAPTTDGALLLDQVSSIVLDDSSNTAVITFGSNIQPVTVSFNLFLSPGAVSPGRSSFTGPYRYVGNALGDGTTAAVTIPLPAQYVAGMKVAWKLRGYDSEGRVSRDQEGMTLIVA